MRVCTSPARSAKSTLSRARTPGNRTVMARIWTTGAASVCAAMSSAGPFEVATAPGAVRGPPPAQLVGRWRVEGSVRAGRQSRRRLLLGERRILGVVLLLDVLTADNLLDQVGRTVAEQRVALDDVVDLPVDQGLQAVVDGVDRHDLDVRAGLATRSLDRLDGPERHVVVVREHQ